MRTNHQVHLYFYFWLDSTLLIGAAGSESEDEDEEEEEEEEESDSGSEDGDEDISEQAKEDAVKRDLTLIFDIIKYADNTTNRIASTLQPPTSLKKKEKKKKDPLTSRMEAVEEPDSSVLLDKAIALLMEDGSETMSIQSYDDT